MYNMSYSSLNFARKLKRLGVPEKQAEAHALILAELAEGNLLNKSEFKAEISEVKAELKTEIQELRSELKIDIQEVRSELKADIQEVKTEIQEVKSEIQEVKSDIKNVRLEIEVKYYQALFAIGGIVSVASATLFAAIKYLP